jgi:hypothetical protein
MNTNPSPNPQLRAAFGAPEPNAHLEQILRNILLSHVIMSEQHRHVPHGGETLIRVHLIPYSGENSIPANVLARCVPRSNFLRRKRRRDSHVSHLPAYSKIKADQLSNLEDGCPVCREAYKSGEYMRELPICKHSFHKRCIDRWLRKDRGRMSCPICRQCHHPESLKSYLDANQDETMQIETN